MVSADVTDLPVHDDAGQFPLFGGGAQTEKVRAMPAIPEAVYSDYIAYVDESGDHGLESVDPNYPVFVLSFCVFNKHYYTRAVVPAVGMFKFKHFGHDLVVLHETDIRKVALRELVWVNSARIKAAGAGT